MHDLAVVAVSLGGSPRRPVARLRLGILESILLVFLRRDSPDPVWECVGTNHNDQIAQGQVKDEAFANEIYTRSLSSPAEVGNTGIHELRTRLPCCLNLDELAQNSFTISATLVFV